MHFPPPPAWTVHFARTHQKESSFALVDSSHIFVVSRPFAPGEKDVIDWAEAQDGAAVRNIVALPDGRDFIVLEREFTRQTRQDAMDEQASRVLSLLLTESQQRFTYVKKSAT